MKTKLIIIIMFGFLVAWVVVGFIVAFVQCIYSKCKDKLQ